MLSRCAMWLLNILGWNVQTKLPGVRKYVVIAAPHTSNWDFPLGILTAWALNLEAHWLGKHSIFRWPFGWFFRALGGTPVIRDKGQNYILQMTELFNDKEKFVLALAPEGTRKKLDHWKTGFHYIARAANVPIAMGYLDFGRKQVGLETVLHPSDDIEADFRKLRAFYEDKRGKIPENESLIQVRKI